MGLPNSDSESPETPTVSVIMGAYNAEATIRRAIDSILAQNFTDWEFVICDDGSEDATLKICKEYSNKHPHQFQVLANSTNRKLPATLNRCLSASRGKYIARMDADDISIPDRFTKQVATLNSQPDVDLVGSAVQRFDESGCTDIVQAPERPDRYTLSREIPFWHATVMTRRLMYEKLGGYNESTRTARSQDIDLWYRFFHEGFTGINLKEPLYAVREDFEAIKRRTVKTRWNVFLITINGYRLLRYPFHWYIRPFLALAKALVPFRAQLWYRSWQQRHRTGTATRPTLADQ